MDYRKLPVYEQRERILEALKDNQVIVVESPTGSGKTTQLPVILYEAGYAAKGMIGVTQPRRIAALSVSEFIAKQLSVELGTLVGYKMRFEDKTDFSTKIKIMTDGILLQEMKLDPMMLRYDVMIVDEAHERSLNIDFILGLLKRVLEARPEFKVIISSATINADIFSSYFGDCPVVKIDTITYPVTLVYDPPLAENNMDVLIEKIIEITERTLASKRNGDILIFLPGEKSIKDCIALLSLCKVKDRLHIIPLYARLGKDEQERVFEEPPPGKVKVVVSTNIAETSVTIDGVTTVIDSGLAKLNFYNPKTFTSSLIEVPISKASANQRKGRAGRTAPGYCYRLYTREDFEGRALFTMEEIYRTDLSEVVLRMAELGITDFERFDFISKPGRSGIIGAIEILNLLDALNPDRTLSTIGTMMCAFPLLPRLSRMIVEAMLKYPDVLEEILIAAAFLSTQSPYVLPPGEEIEARSAHHAFRDRNGDFVSYLKLFKAFVHSGNKTKFCETNYLDERTMLEIVRIKEQIELIVHEQGMVIGSGGPVEHYLTAVGRGLIQFVCIKEERGLFRTLMGERVLIHPGSVMFRESPSFIVAGEIVKTTRMYAMSVSPLTKEILERISPTLYARLKRFAPEMPVQAAIQKKQKVPMELHGESLAKAKAQDRGQKKHIHLPELEKGFAVSGTVFPVEEVKKKKKVRLDWDTFKPLREAFAACPPERLKGYLGVINYKHKIFLDNEKLSVIVKIASWLDPEKDLTKKWPRNKLFNIHEHLSELVLAFPSILQLSVWKDKSNELGFVGLFTDGEGNYYFRVSRGFHTAITESLASLETFIDEAGSMLTGENREYVNELYRKLASFFED